MDDQNNNPNSVGQIDGVSSRRPIQPKTRSGPLVDGVAQPATPFSEEPTTADTSAPTAGTQADPGVSTTQTDNQQAPRPVAPAKPPKQPGASLVTKAAITLIVLVGLGLIAVAVMAYLEEQQEPTNQQPAATSQAADPTPEQTIEESGQAVDEAINELEDTSTLDDEAALSDQSLGL